MPQSLGLRQVVHSHLAWSLLLLQAVERAISELTRLERPLVKESEVAELTMGARSKEKVLEIIQTGTLRRNEMMADDEEQQIMQMVLFNPFKCMMNPPTPSFSALHAAQCDQPILAGVIQKTSILCVWDTHVVVKIVMAMQNATTTECLCTLEV